MKISKSGDMISMLGKPSKNRWGFEISMLCLFHHTYATSWTNFDTSNIERSCDYDRPSPPPGPPSDNSSISASDFWEGSLRGECTLAYCWIWNKTRYYKYSCFGVLVFGQDGKFAFWGTTSKQCWTFWHQELETANLAHGHFGTRTIWQNLLNLSCQEFNPIDWGLRGKKLFLLDFIKVSGK